MVMINLFIKIEYENWFLMVEFVHDVDIIPFCFPVIDFALDSRMNKHKQTFLFLFGPEYKQTWNRKTSGKSGPHFLIQMCNEWKRPVKKPLNLDIIGPILAIPNPSPSPPRTQH